MMKLRLEVQEITAITTQSSAQATQEHLAMSKVFLSIMTGVDERVARVEELLHTQSRLLQNRQFTQVGSSYHAPVRPKSPTTPSKLEKATAPATPQNSIGIRVRPYITTCQTSCPCSCHAPQRSATPGILNSILGRLFIGYSGFPVLNPKCDNGECSGTHDKQVTAEYWFPTGVWSGIVRMQAVMSLNGGPSLSLDVLRRIPDSSTSVDFAQKGDIKGLQHLFRDGLASPRDISASRGYSLLRWALYAKQYEAVEFLVHAGADPDYRPIAASDNSPRIKACHFLLEGGLSETATKALRTITKGGDYLDDFIDGSKFTKTHKIVLGLSLQSLEDELLLNLGDINAQDAMGRTPLAWAAAKGDTQAVTILLSYGADPNITDAQISGPLSNAAAQGHTACVELLLEAGADPDPPLPKGITKGSPLSVASRNCRDATLLKRLLDFGADAKTLTVENKTPLFHATRNDNASFAILLLEYGADINAMATTGETPLTTAITYNSHNVLRLFLDRWFEYTICPRLKGPNLLKTAAAHGDCQTLRMLADADHFRSKYDKDYMLADFKTLLRQRGDVTEDLTAAFERLLTVLSTAPDPRQGMDGLLESGVLPYLGVPSKTFEDAFERPGNISDEGSNDSFHDAPEKQEGNP